MHQWTSKLVFALLCVAAASLYTPSHAAESLRIAGSDTLAPVTQVWLDTLKRDQPQLQSSLQHEGSSSAPPLLLDGRIDIAAMSRPMTRKERKAFKKKYGYAPTQIQVGLDALAVYVHKDNPVKGLTMDQLSRIFAEVPLCGGKPHTQWHEVSMMPKGYDIHLHGRNDLSGSHHTFAQEVLCDGDFSSKLVEHNDSQSVVDAVAADKHAIGYAGIGYANPNVRALAIGVGDAESNTRYFPHIIDKYKDHADPKKRHAYVYRGKYPLARALYFYVNKAPGKPLENAAAESFLKLALSKQGQQMLSEQGYMPLTEKQQSVALAKLPADAKKRPWWKFF